MGIRYTGCPKTAAYSTQGALRAPQPAVCSTQGALRVPKGLRVGHPTTFAAADTVHRGSGLGIRHFGHSGHLQAVVSDRLTADRYGDLAQTDAARKSCHGCHSVTGSVLGRDGVLDSHRRGGCERPSAVPGGRRTLSSTACRHARRQTLMNRFTEEKHDEHERQAVCS